MNNVTVVKALQIFRSASKETFMRVFSVNAEHLFEKFTELYDRDVLRFVGTLDTDNVQLFYAHLDILTDEVTARQNSTLEAKDYDKRVKEHRISLFKRVIHKG
jgi:predicted ATPase